MARVGLDDFRGGWKAKDLSGIVDGVRDIATAAEFCRVGLALPAPQTFRFVPVANTYLAAAEHGCSAARNFGAATDTAAAQRLIKNFGTRELNGATLADSALIEGLFQAASSSAPYLVKAAADIDELTQLKLGNGTQKQIARLAVTLNRERVENIISLAAAGPTLLGLDEPKTYFVALLSNAEMRAGGGFLGQYAILRFEDGRAIIEKSGSNAALPPVANQNPNLIPGISELVGVDNPEWVNVNLSPHGPDAGSSVVRSWFLGTGQRLDGYIAIDVTTAARLAAIAGEGIVTPDGVRIQGATEMADYAQNGVYFDFASPSESAGPRKAYQVAVLQQLLRQTAASLSRLDSLLSILPEALEEQRITIWFSDPALQKRIAKSPAARDVRRFPERLSLTFNNGSGNKFDFYLKFTAELSCRREGIKQFSVKVRADADPDVAYPPYIGQRLDKPTEKRASTFNQYLVALPHGAQIRFAKLDGVLINPVLVRAGGREFLEAPFEIFAGQERKLTLNFWGKMTSWQLPGERAQPVSCR